MDVTKKGHFPDFTDHRCMHHIFKSPYKKLYKKWIKSSLSAFAYFLRKDAVTAKIVLQKFEFKEYSLNETRVIKSFLYIDLFKSTTFEYYLKFCNLWDSEANS